MTKKANVPEIRFKEFSGNWLDSLLGEHGSVSMCKRIFKNQTAPEGEVPFFKIGTFGDIPDSYIKKKVFEDYKAKYPYPKVGDVLISASGSIGRTVTYSGSDEYFQDSNIVWLNHDERLENSFLEQFYSIVKWEGLEGSTIKRLYNKNILNTKIQVPLPDEQKKIGIYLQNIDRLISLNLKKYEKLLNVKKAMLEKMFPRDGVVVPEIRFKGFSEAWGQYPLGDLAKLTSSKRVRRDDYVESGIPFFRGSEISKLRTSLTLEGVLYISTEQYFELKENFGVPGIGDILLTAVGTLGNSFLVTDNTPFYFKDGNLIWLREIKISPQYLNIFISEGIGKRRVLDSAAGSSQKALTMVTLQNVQALVPDKEEQNRVGIFIEKLNNLINLHQIQIEKLKNIKKAMLEKMFV